MSDEEKTEEELIRALSKEDFERSKTMHAEEDLRRQREGRAWVCTSCGTRMGYDYIEEGSFDEKGCISCGHTEAIEILEATTE